MDTKALSTFHLKLLNMETFKAFADLTINASDLSTKDVLARLSSRIYRSSESLMTSEESKTIAKNLLRYMELPDINKLSNVADLTPIPVPCPIPAQAPPAPPAPPASAPAPVTSLVVIEVRSYEHPTRAIGEYMLCTTTDFNNFTSVASQYKFCLSEHTNYYILLANVLPDKSIHSLNSIDKAIINGYVREVNKTMDYIFINLMNNPLLTTSRKLANIYNQKITNSMKIDRMRNFMYSFTGYFSSTLKSKVIKNNRNYLLLELSKRILNEYNDKRKVKMPIEPAVPTMPGNVANLKSLFTDAIKVEHRVYVNDTQLCNMYKPDIMRLIVKVEQDIQDLKSIKSKSKAITNEIRRQKKALKFIVKYLDQS